MKKSIGFTKGFGQGQMKKHWFDNILAERQTKTTLVLQWFWLGSNENALVLHWFCLGSNEKALVLLCFCSASNEKGLVLHWFCLGVAQAQTATMMLTVLFWGPTKQHWFYNGFAKGPTDKLWFYIAFDLAPTKKHWFCN